MQTNNPESGFNSDHTIRQYAHGLLLESPFVLSSTDRCHLLGCTGKNKAKTAISVAVEAKPEVEIWRRPKNNFLSLVSYSLLQTVLATIQNITDRQQTTDRQTTQCTIGWTDSTVGQKIASGCNNLPDTGQHNIFEKSTYLQLLLYFGFYRIIISNISKLQWYFSQARKLLYVSGDMHPHLP